MSGRQAAGVAIVGGANAALFATMGFCLGFKGVFAGVGLAVVLGAIIAYGCYLMEEA